MTRYSLFWLHYQQLFTSYITYNIPEKPAHYNDFSERYVPLCEYLLKQGYQYSFWSKQLSSSFKKQSTLFANYSKSFVDIKKDMFLLHQWKVILS